MSQIKTKEELLDEHCKISDMYVPIEDVLPYESASMVMDTYAEQTATNFAEWVDKSGYKWQDGHERCGWAAWRPLPKEGKQIMTTSELFTLYKQSINL